MISRIVKMFFDEDKISDFMKTFEDSKQKIRNFEGCNHLQLLRHQTLKNVIYTYSIWDSEDALNSYRKSDLFRETWRKTKVCFCEKPITYTLDQLDWVE